MSKIVACVVDGKELHLLFSLAALNQINERLGDIDILFDAFRTEREDERIVREQIMEALPPKEKAKRKLALEARAKEGKRKTTQLLPFIIATMAAQGQLFEGERDHDKLITESWVESHTFPYDIEPLTVAMCTAISKGMKMSSSQGNADEAEDVVREQISKNVVSAEG